MVPSHPMEPGDARHELEVPNEISAQISWYPGRFRIRDLPRRLSWSSGGVYIVEKGTTPVYVGETHGFVGRWRGRTAIFRELRLSGSVLDPYFLRLGRVRMAGRTGGRDDRRAAERVLVRYLIKHKGFPLTNHMVKREFLVGSGGVSLRSSGNRPPYLPSEIRRPGGSRFELHPTYADGGA